MTDIIIHDDGTVRCLYDDQVAELLRKLGHLHIQRASHIEPSANGWWLADLSPVGGPTLGPFSTRRNAIAAEVRWLKHHRNL